jgi:DNA-binding NtrC family response regulator
MNSEDKPRKPILIVDDEESILLAMDTVLRMAGYNNIILCDDSRLAMGLVEQHGAEVVLTDLTMPHLGGRQLLAAITTEYPDIPVIVITVSDDTDTAVQCMKTGAFDFIVKPVNPGRLTTAISKAEQFSGLRRENDALRSHLLTGDTETVEGFSDIITRSRKMHSIFHYIDAIAPTSQAVLVTGETGVGKELVAKTLHKKSGRPGPFITVNAAGLDDTIFSDTLFGHVRGAFTGADAPRKGLIEQAAGGTLLLDEIGSLSLYSQAKLLRLLQESEYLPLGLDRVCKADVRIIAATNEDLDTLARKNKFRKDLLFRLQTHHIHIPPLRERLDDIPLLVDHFIEMAARSLGRNKVAYPPELLTLLQTYPFPGNVRELQAIIFDAVSRHQKGVLSLSVTEDYLAKRRQDPANPVSVTPRDAIVFPDTLPTIEETSQALVLEALRRTKGNQSTAARLLGISQQAVNKRLKKMRQEIRTKA